MVGGPLAVGDRNSAQWLTSHAAEGRCEMALGPPRHPLPWLLGSQLWDHRSLIQKQKSGLWVTSTSGAWRGWSPTVLIDSSHWDHGLQGAERVTVQTENSKRPVGPCFLNFIKSPTEKLIFVCLPIDTGTESLQRCCKTLSTSNPHTVLFIFNLV